MPIVDAVDALNDRRSIDSFRASKEVSLLIADGHSWAGLLDGNQVK